MLASTRRPTTKGCRRGNLESSPYVTSTGLVASTALVCRIRILWYSVRGRSKEGIAVNPLVFVIQHTSPRGRLRHGNPSGDYAKAPRCGARTRAGGCCRQPAMKNGRCRMHGGLSTGPRTAEGLARSRRARWKHGFDSAEIRALRRETMLTARCLAGLVRLANAKFPRAEFPSRSPRRRRVGARPRPAAQASSSGTRMPSSLGMGSIARISVFPSVPLDEAQQGSPHPPSLKLRRM